MSDHQSIERINVGEAKRKLEELLILVELGKCPGFVLCKRGKPYALLVPLETE
jgi:antitoxin (DNA-binding transcriptional repressor) of toxin-antitoxin stability system